MVDSRTVFERRCSAASSAIIRSNCKMELMYPLALASPFSTRLSNACATTGRLCGKYRTSQPYSPIVSHVALATWCALPSQPLLPHLEINTLETLTVSLQSNRGQKLSAGAFRACSPPRLLTGTSNCQV